MAAVRTCLDIRDAGVLVGKQRETRLADQEDDRHVRDHADVQTRTLSFVESSEATAAVAAVAASTIEDRVSAQLSICADMANGLSALDLPDRPLSPHRHHFRIVAAPRTVKETRDAKYRQGENGTWLLNQYVLKMEIGCGRFGIVHLAEDRDLGEKVAIKEYSKAMLRKRSISSMIKRHRGYLSSKGGVEQYNREVTEDPISLIRGEIAIMKKLHHVNLVSLIEVLDPKGGSLFMVMDWCEKGVVMDIKPGGGTVEPYSDAQCRNFFRDLILGVEYLHYNGIVHRDIKPDNLLLAQDDTLKIADYGVSEMFQNENDLFGRDTVGSPAFTAPELVNIQIKEVSGKAADIWAMGVTLYCFKFGRLPFYDSHIIGLFDQIKYEQPKIPEAEAGNLRDLFARILEKDPETRIKMPDLRVHPWVTLGGLDPLLSTFENTKAYVSEVSNEDMREAIIDGNRFRACFA